jgi:hypothetical protein
MQTHRPPLTVAADRNQPAWRQQSGRLGLELNNADASATPVTMASISHTPHKYRSTPVGGADLFYKPRTQAGWQRGLNSELSKGDFNDITGHKQIYRSWHQSDSIVFWNEPGLGRPTADATAQRSAPRPLTRCSHQGITNAAAEARPQRRNKRATVQGRTPGTN